MKIAAVEKTLTRLAQLIAEGRFEELETDTLEIKPVPADGNDWKERYKSALAKLAQMRLEGETSMALLQLITSAVPGWRHDPFLS